MRKSFAPTSLTSCTTTALPSRLAFASCVLLCTLAIAPARGQFQPAFQHTIPNECILPEQRSLTVRAPFELPSVPTPNEGSPKTIENYEAERETIYLSLDEAIELTLRNAEVVRVLQGTTAGSTGRTVYDAAITNTQVDVAQSQFDPNLTAGIDVSRSENPSAVFDPTVPGGVRIQGSDVTTSNFRAGLTERNLNGGTVSLNARATPTNIAPNAGLPINPQTPTSLDVSYNQPLLRGRGFDVNAAPIVIARINTERSLYQFKDSVQDMVRSVIDGYWQLVSARVRLWALEQQIEQLEFALDSFDAQAKVGSADLGQTAQARVSLTSFKANLINIRSEILDREAALFNVMGLPPRPNVRLLPTTAPAKDLSDFAWDDVLSVAAENRPDLIELKLNLEATQQQLNVDCNNTLPQLDMVGLLRFNGLGGRIAGGGTAVSDFLQFNDLQFGLSLQTPVGQRAARAQFRQDQLTLARNYALLRQQVHTVTHQLAQSSRNLQRFFKQYEAFREVRAASRTNLKRQIDFFAGGGISTERIIYLNVLQAITDWGNAVNSEANALALYNSAIATLSQQKGTILEEHGVQFQEQCYASVGPFGRCTDQPYSYSRDPMYQRYPHHVSVSENQERYPDNGEPAEKSFNLESFEASRKPTDQTDLEDIDLDEELRKMDLRRKSEESSIPELDELDLDDLLGDAPDVDGSGLDSLDFDKLRDPANRQPPRESLPGPSDEPSPLPELDDGLELGPLGPPKGLLDRVRDKLKPPL